MEEVWFRPAWEAEDVPRHHACGRSVHTSEALLIPLARAQDALARLDAAVAAAPDLRVISS